MAAGGEHVEWEVQVRARYRQRDTLGGDEGGRAMRGKKKRGGVDGSVLNEKDGDNYDDANSWDRHNLDVRAKEGTEWGNEERDEGDSNNDHEESEEEEEEGKGDGSRM